MYFVSLGQAFDQQLPHQYIIFFEKKLDVEDSYYKILVIMILYDINYIVME